jgi:hypothetical protein
MNLPVNNADSLAFPNGLPRLHTVDLFVYRVKCKSCAELSIN